MCTINEFAFTVRTYNVIKRHFGKVPTTPAECISFADTVAAGRVRNAGVQTAIELYRFGGLGVYQIERKLSSRGERAVALVRSRCEHLDRYYIHDRLD